MDFTQTARNSKRCLSDLFGPLDTSFNLGDFVEDENFLGLVHHNDFDGYMAFTQSSSKEKKKSKTFKNIKKIHIPARTPPRMWPRQVRSEHEETEFLLRDKRGITSLGSSSRIDWKCTKARSTHQEMQPHLVILE